MEWEFDFLFCLLLYARNKMKLEVYPEKYIELK